MLLANPVTRRIAFLGAGVFLFFYLAFGVNFDLLKVRLNQIDIEVERRVQSNPGPSTDEEVFCRTSHGLSSKEPIPNVAHFIMLEPRGTPVKITFTKYLAFKSAVLRMGAAQIKLHTWDGVVESGEYWNELKQHVDVVNLDAYQDVKGPHGLHLSDFWLPHQADILRLAILQREGGIYLDTDVFVLKPFSDLLSNPRDTIMGHEGGNRYGLCNAVIVSRPNSTFLEKWRAEYEASFNPTHWNEHSVLVPKRLQASYPELICPLAPTAFFWPTWATAHYHYMHDTLDSTEVAKFRNTLNDFGGVMYGDQLSFHAWGNHDLFNNITMQRIQTEDTRFNLLLREVVNADL